MNRKRFIAALSSASALLFTDVLKASDPDPRRTRKIIVPPYLNNGDTIGITCPSGFIMEKDLQPAIEQIKKWGFQVIEGNTVGKRDFTFGGTDEERRKDFQDMIDNPDVKAILCARGGYGAVRIIDQLDFSSLRKNPKWVIGFSDITVFHSHLHANSGIATIHSKMCNSFPDDWSKAEPIQVETIISLKDALQGERLVYNGGICEKNKPGIGEGLLIGGNLKMLETLAGTPSDISTDDKILFVEDVGEALYSIDRMFCNLKRSGKLDRLKGLLVGSFTAIKPEVQGEEFGKTLYDIVLEKVKEYDYPVCFGFPVGHQKSNFALKCGMKHRLTIDSNHSVLEEV
ncbi:MAG: LD-carboxypeptidase [Bacteroidota bacterium]